MKISAISYLNTVPFIYGIQKAGLSQIFNITYDVPSTCAEKLIHNETDIGIVPVATIPLIPQAEILTQYCIGAVGKVKTVILASHSPIKDILTIYLDPDSRTSVKLVKVLAKHWWKKEFSWEPGAWNSRPTNQQTNKPTDLKESAVGSRQSAVGSRQPAIGSGKSGVGYVLIGDKTFGLEKQFPYIYDLAEEWWKFTGLPFVFACWVANKPIPESFCSQFEAAIAYGIANRHQAALELDPSRYPGVDAEEYLVKTISYDFDEEKKKGLALFLKYLEEV